MGPPIWPDPEVEMVERLYVSTARSGASVAGIDIANSFVALGTVAYNGFIALMVGSHFY